MASGILMKTIELYRKEASGDRQLYLPATTANVVSLHGYTQLPTGDITEISSSVSALDAIRILDAKNRLLDTSKAAAVHKHKASDITDFSTAVSGIKVASAATADSVNWSGIKNIPTSFTPSSHNQSSKTINAMTGYSKATSVSAITTSDTLNAAIGKLEKALDTKQASGNYLTQHPSISLAADTTSTASPAHGGTFTAVDGVTRDANGHVTTINTKTVTLPQQYSLPTASTTVKGGVMVGSGLSITDGKLNATGVQSVATGATKGTISVDGSDIAVKGLGSNAYTSTSFAPINSPALTGTPTAPTAAVSTNSTQIATTAFVQNLVNNKIAASDAMIYKGTIGTSGTVTALPDTHTTGWTYKVITAGTYAGQPCEVGDMIVCLNDGTTAKDSDWTVVQSNIDGAVTGPTSSTDAHIAVFNGATGKVIKDSGFTIGTSVPANAKFTDTTYTAATASKLGLVKIGSNITVSSGIISLTKGDVVSALGYTPPTTDTNTHYATGLKVGAASTDKNNVAASNGSVYLNILDDSTIRDSHLIKGSGSVSVTSDESGIITINGTPTTYTGGSGISVSGTSIANTGVLSVAAGSTANVLSVNTGGKTSSITINNVANATKATQDSAGQTISSTYIKDLSISGKTITITKGSGSTSTITTQDTTYNDMGGATSSVAGTHGLVPAPAAGKQASYLRGDGTWATPTNTWIAFKGAASNAPGTAGYVPAPAAGDEDKFFRADGTWANPANTTYSAGAGISLSGTTFSNSGVRSIAAGSTANVLSVNTNGTTSSITINNVANAAAATKATQDSAGQQIDTTYIKGLSVSGKTITYTKGDGTTGTITTQDTNTTYGAATSSALGLVKIGSNITNSSGTISLTKANVTNALGYTPPTSDTTYSVMGAATSSADGSSGLVPAPAKGKQASFLRGDGTWVVPTNTTYSAGAGIGLSGTTFSNTGVRSVAAGSSANELSVNTNGSTATITIDNVANATKATQDSAGQQINTTYIKGLSVSGKTITYTKGDGTTGTITTQDTNTTYSVMKGATADAAGAQGLVPAPAKGAQTKYLRGDGTWVVPTNTWTAFKGATSSAAGTAGYVPAPAAGDQAKFFKADGTWATPTNTTYSAGNGISLSGTTFSNSGVRSVAAGSSANQITVNTGGTEKTITVNNVSNAATADKLTTGRTIGLSGAVTGSVTFDGSANKTISTTLSNFDASKITSGTIDLARIPKAAIPELKIVADDTARFALTTSDIQNGDTVQVTSTGKMYFVKDQTKLSSEDGYAVYTAGAASSVPWSGVTGKPSSYTPAAHTQAASTITGLATVATSGSYADLSNKPTIPSKVSQLTNDSGYITGVSWSQVSNKPTSFTPASHNQASNTITALTGYSKPSSTGAIGTSDSLNAALGKLEKALDGKLSTSGTAASATKATQDSAGQQINTTYIKGLSVSGKTITYTKGDGTTGTITTQDTNTTYGAATSSALGLVKIGSNITNSSGTISLTKDNVTAALGYTPPTTDTNTWRGIQNNLTSDSITESLSAAQGKALKALVDSKAASNHTHNYAGSSSAGGSANSAVKLATARTIAIGTGATGTATSFDGSGNITIPITDVKESYLSWGGKNFSGAYGCIDAAMIPDLGANRLAFGNASGIKVEYSTNGGSSWTDYGLNNSQKTGLFGTGTSVNIGKATTSTISTSCKLRITIDSDSFGVYTALNKFAIYVSTNGSSGSYCTIEASKESTPTSFETIANNIPISGWSGWNIINTKEIVSFGNSSSASSQYGLIRFTFGCTGVNKNYSGLCVMRIMGFGGVGWTVPSNMARYGTIYSYDNSQNVTFPASVTATSFSGSLSGNASTASKATQDSAGQQINTTYIKGLSVSGKTITYTKGDGTTGTITTQDTNTTYSAGTGISLSGTSFSNAGVRSIAAGSSANQLSVNTGGTTSTITINNVANATSAGSATKATQDSAGQQINTTYIKGLSVSGKTITYTKGDGTTGTITTQDTNTTYSTFKGATSSAAGGTGLVPAPAKGAQAKYLRADGTWQTPPDTNTTYSASNGISLSGTTFSNSGVRSIATGSSNGTISVNTNGTTANVAVKGLGSAAYSNTSAFAAASHTHPQDNNFLAHGNEFNFIPTLTANTDIHFNYRQTGGNNTSGYKITNYHFSNGAGSTDGVTVIAGTFSGALSGNASSATKATKDSADQQITTTYIKGLSVSGKTITYTKGDGSTGTITTQDTNTTYSAFKGATSSAAGGAGLVPAPAAGAQAKYLRADGTWQTPPDTNTTYSVFKGATSSAAGGTGLVPAPAKGAQAKYLRADGTWQTPPDTNTTYSAATSSNLGLVKIGSNISVSSGTISLTKANITNALGYTPPTTDTNTHYTTHAKVGASATATANAAASNGSVYLNILDDSTVRDSHLIKGAGATTVTSDANGVITISSTDTNTNTTYSAGTGISLSGTTFSNAGVRSVATGSTNGTISVNTNGTVNNIAVKGLGSAAYSNTNAFAAASHSHSNYALKTDIPSVWDADGHLVSPAGWSIWITSENA